MHNVYPKYTKEFKIVAKGLNDIKLLLISLA